MFRHTLKLILLLVLLIISSRGQAQVQLLRFEPIITSAAANSTLSLDLLYATDPATPALTGLGLRLHWDSTQLNLNDFMPAVGFALRGQTMAQLDALDFDSNPATDRFTVIAWADPAAGWPGFSSGLLGTASVSLAPSFSGVTTLGISSTSTPVGWRLSDIPATISDPSIGIPAAELVLKKRWLSLDGRTGIDFGGEAFFELEVINTGLIGIDDIMVTDALVPDCERNIDRLLAGESQTWQCSLQNVVASFVNEASAIGSALDNNASEVTATASAAVTVLDPLLAILLTPAEQQVRIGEQAQFSVSIRNDGAQALNQVQIRSQQVPSCNLDLAQLDPGDETSWSCSKANVQQDFNHNLVASALIGSASTPTLLNQASAEVLAVDPGLLLELTANPDRVEIGGSVLFTLRLSNSGNADLTDLVITSSELSSCNRQFSALASTASLSWSCQVDNIQQDFTLNAEASAMPPVGDVVTATDSIDISTFILVFRDGFE